MVLNQLVCVQVFALGYFVIFHTSIANESNQLAAGSECHNQLMRG